jgi:hypothetical protein
MVVILKLGFDKNADKVVVLTDIWAVYKLCIGFGFQIFLGQLALDS